MHKILLALIVAAGLTGVLAAPARADAVRLALDSGPVVGSSDGQVAAFKGIPYAAPPVGELRWRAPQPPTPWKTDRQALDYGASCMQGEIPRFTAPASRAVQTSEDCLTLNVWAPAKARDAPVLVWIHGGGNTTGTASQIFYDGTAFARDGVVLVSMNYRLGVLGFFAHPQLQVGAVGDANFGLLDQAAALRWVQRNIRAFGGDPAKVTVIGESAGGQDILALMAAHSAKGLFSKAIIESPGGKWGRYPALDQAKGDGAALAKTLGAANLADLRKLPADTLVKAGADLEVGPVFDGTLLSENPLKAIDAGHAPAIPLLIGSNSGEGSFIPQRTTLSNGPVHFSPGEVEALKAAYGTGDDHALAQLAYRDGFFAGPVRWIAGHAKAPAYLYRFDYVAEALRRRGPDAGHASEIPFVFGTAGVYARGVDDQQVANLVHGCWVAFVKTGVPACPGAPTWPAYTLADDRVMLLTDKPQYVPNPTAKAIDLLVAKAGDQRRP